VGHHRLIQLKKPENSAERTNCPVDTSYLAADKILVQHLSNSCEFEECSLSHLPVENTSKVV